MDTKKISLGCPHCQAFQTLEITEAKQSFSFACGHCQKDITLGGIGQEPVSCCPVCGNLEFYQHKDFNKALGLAIFVLGAVLVPWTYSLSMFVALAIDAALYPFFPWMLVCYDCKSELRGWPKNPKLDRFNHERAAHYEYGQKKRETAQTNSNHLANP